MGILNIASLGLLIGALGQSLLWGNPFPRLPQWIVLIQFLPPWLTVYTISFCRQAPFGPRVFRHCLMFAMCWYATMTMLVEARYLFFHIEQHGRFEIVAAQSLTTLGIFALIVLVWAWVRIRRFENGDA